jgi:hypothetical protein
VNPIFVGLRKNVTRALTDSSRRNPSQKLTQIGLSEHESQAVTEYVTSLSSGTASDEQSARTKTLLSKLGPAGAVIWDQIKDFGARVVADMLKS